MRPLDDDDPPGPPRESLQRMQPRSTARVSASTSVARRRSERRVRKSRVQALRTAPTTARRHRISAWQLVSWRAVSAMLVVGLGVLVYLFVTADAFFVNSVAIGGERYLTREEIFRYSGVAREHIFWVDPAEVEARLEAFPNIADASVFVGWPPNLVQIVVVEREPALTWEQGVRVWVDVNGIVMDQRLDRPDLLRVVYSNAAEPIGPGQRIPQTVVDGALQLRRHHPNIDVLLYDPMKGLGYRDGRGWNVWFGSGEDIDTKLLVYNAITAQIIGQGIQPGEIVVVDPDRPYYTILWGPTGS